MELNSFIIFLTVVEEMSFTKAAERLYITQQALSSHIKRLERIYGVSLFQRHPVLKLSEAGEAMVYYAQQMVTSETNMVARFSDILQNSGGCVRLGISRQRSQLFLSGIWSSFSQACPNATVRLKERSTKYLLEMLQAGQIDLMVGIDVPQAKNLDITFLMEEYNCCILSERLLKKYYPDNWEKKLQQFHREGIALSALRDFPLALLPTSNNIRKKIDKAFSIERCMPKVKLETNEQKLIFDVSCFGEAVGIVTPAIVYSRLSSDLPMPADCHLFKLKDIPANTVSVITLRDIDQPDYVRAMKNAVLEEFGYYKAMLGRLI